MSYPVDPRQPPSPDTPLSPPQQGRGAAPVAIAVTAILVLLVGGIVAAVLLAGGADERSAADESTTVSTPGTPTPTGQTGTTTASTSAQQTRYCQQMSILQLKLTSFQTGTLTDSDLGEMVTALEELTPVAPAGAVSDLDTFLGGLTSLQGLLHELDITFDQFQDVAFLTDAATDWTPDQLQQIQNVTTQLTNPTFLDAGRNIDADFRTRC